MYINPNLQPRLPQITPSSVLTTSNTPLDYSLTRTSTSTSSRVPRNSVTNTRSVGSASYSSYSYNRSAVPYSSATSRSSSSSFGGNGGLPSPLKFIIPIFAVFFAIVSLSMIIRCTRRSSLSSKFNRTSYPPTQMGYERTTSLTNPYVNRNSHPNRSNTPFEIDPPRITPYPLPESTMTQSSLSNPVIQDLPAAYHFTPSARERVDTMPISSLPEYQRSEIGGGGLPPTYEEVTRSVNR